MSDHFAKLWRSILHSSVWQNPAPTKLVWITMLALAEQDGYVGASIIGIAHAAGVSVEEAQAAIDTFLRPDPYSRSKEHEGRRIAVVDRGWKILNYAKFREQRDMLAKRQADAERQRRKRERDASVTERDASEVSPKVAHVDVDGDEDIHSPTQGSGTRNQNGEGLSTAGTVAVPANPAFEAEASRIVQDVARALEATTIYPGPRSLNTRSAMGRKTEGG